MKSKELFNELWDCEQFTNKNRYVGKVKYILMHPKEFMELASDSESIRYLARTETGWIFAGIPLIQSNEIERVDFCI
jgi:hypothetical protein